LEQWVVGTISKGPKYELERNNDLDSSPQFSALLTLASASGGTLDDLKKTIGKSSAEVVDMLRLLRGLHLVDEISHLTIAGPTQTYKFSELGKEWFMRLIEEAYEIPEAETQVVLAR